MDRREVEAEITRFMILRVLIPVIVGGLIGWNWDTIKGWF